MPYKDPEAHKEYQRTWINGKRESDRESARDIRRRLKQDRIAWVNSLKMNPCMDCGQSYPPFVMDFDHRDPSAKKIGIAQMVRGGWAKDRILAEIAKCDLVCANCHRIRTHS